MAWSDYPKEIRQFSRLVADAAAQTFGSAATVQIVAAAAKAANVTLPFNAFAGIAKLYGDTVRARNAATDYQLAVTESVRNRADFTITPNMISRQPWSPAQSGFAGDPFVLVRAEYTLETPEGTKTGVFSHRYSVSDIHTNHQVRADLQLQLDQGAGGSDLAGAELGDIVGVEWSTP